ncbi:lantibiotic ABC transporter permease [Enterococcus sp. LJL120]
MTKVILTVLRISVLIVALYGWAVFFREDLKFNAKISWLAGIAAIIWVLYLAAYLSLLAIAGYLLFTAGILRAAVYLFQGWRKKSLHLPPLDTLRIWLVFYFLLFAYTLLQSHLVHYDNFSHWATIVKFLYAEGRLPTAADTIISFTSYPMGSSLFVYFGTLIAGFGDNVMLLTQFILIFSCFYAFFAIVRDESRTLIITMMFSFIAVFNYFNIAIRMNNLLVDFLLPLLTLAGIAGIYKMQRQLVQMTSYTILIGGALSIVKNSALFFVAILLIYYLSRVVLLWKFRKNKFQLVGVSLLTMFAAIAPYLVWSRHVAATFTESKHEVSLSSYQEIFSEKGSQTISQIGSVFLKTIASLSTPSTQGILLANLLILGAFLVIRFRLHRKNSLLRYWGIMNVIVVSYYLGIYAMFLFSMPTDEALTLAGFERYASSIVIFALGLVMFVLAREIDYSFFEQNIAVRSFRSFKSLKTKKWYQYFTLGFLFFATLMILSENNGMMYNNATFEDSIPAQYQEVTGNQMTLNQQKYLVVSTDQTDVDSYLVGYVGSYYLFSANVTGQENFVLDDQAFIDLLNQYDQLVILEDHYTFDAMTEKLYGFTLEPGVYNIEETFGQTSVS